MKTLLDSGVWFRRYWQGPMHPGLRRLLETEVTEFWLSPLSVAEMLYKYRHRRLPCPDPGTWLEDALVNLHLAPLTFDIGRQAGLWPWPHGDPVDRVLAATAEGLGLVLVHTDTRLKNLPGFPQRFFPNVDR